MDNQLKVLVSAGIGAAAMYYLDPVRGRYRRSLVRDQIVHGEHKAARGAGIVHRDMRNRATGLTARLRSVVNSKQPDDAVLVERVRACLGRVSSHPHAIKVEASDGLVTVSGPVLEEEVPLLIDSILGVPGVRDIRDQLDVHAEPDGLSALQGGSAGRLGERPGFMQSNWSPTARTAGGLAGALTAVCGFGQRNAIGTLLGSAGLILTARAATNLEMRRLFGIGASRHAVDIQKSIRIHAPVEKVFELWDDFANFPRFMTHVRHVSRIKNGRNKERWRWIVTGPTGTQFEFDSVVTARVENRLLAWRTEGNALIQHAGRVQFQDNGDGSTTVDINMAYNPVVGAVGHAVARMFSADPRHQMHDDLLRMKSFLETGKIPRDAAGHAA